jgi:DNA-binding NtrC family response regulator
MPTARSEGPNPSDPVVLFVDDEETARSTFRRLFAHEPIVILTAASGLAALDLLAGRSVNLVVSDYWMRGMHGIAFLGEVGRLYPGLPRLLFTGLPDSQIVLDAGVRVLTKDMDPGLIRRVILREARRRG